MIEELSGIPQESVFSKEMVSVIIPVYKVEKYLSKCVESVRKQTYQNIQIILVDDGSPDRCGAMCDQYANLDQRIEVIHKNNGGLASARNAGLRVAKGEWIAWVDSDDWVAEDMIEYLLKGAQQNQAEVAICGRYEVYPKKKYLQGAERVKILNAEEALHMLLDVKNRQIENFMWDKIWRRSLFDGILFPEGKTFEDFAVTFRLIERANSIVCLPDPKYFYLQRNGSIMKDASIENQINRYEAARTRYDGMIEKWPQFEEMLVDRCIRMAVNVWNSYYRSSKDERRIMRARLYEISHFLTPYIKEGVCPNSLGLAGRLTVKLLPYPYFWSFFTAEIIQWLYKVKRGAIKMGLKRTLKCFKQNWTVCYNTAKHFLKNGWARRNARYIKQYRQLPIKENVVLYDSFWGRGAMCNPYGIFEYLLNAPEFANFEHIWALDKVEDYPDFVKQYKNCSNVRFVHYMQRDYLKALCEAKYLINNTAYPKFFIKREGQIYINTWHGIPLKKIGPDMPGGVLESGNAIRNFLQTDYMISANPFLTRIYRTTYSLDNLYKGKIIEEGYPRLDTLVRCSRKEYEARLREMGVTIDPHRKTILYAPTWRENKNGKKYVSLILEEYKEVRNRIEAELPEYQVLIKVHQYVYRQIKDVDYPSYIIPATVDANEVLPIADVLLGDYSSIYFDYLYFERPILFFIPDIAQYKDHRGLYMSIDTLPGPASEDLGEIIKWLRDIDKVQAQYKEKLLEAKKWCCDYDVGNIAKRIADIVFRGRSEDRMLIDVSGNKKAVLIQTGSLANASTVYMLTSLLDSIDLEMYDVTLATPTPYSWQEKDLYERFDPRVRVIVQNRYVNVTPRDDAKNRLVRAYGFSDWRKKQFPAWIYLEEMHKRYGNSQFEVAIHLGDYNFTDMMVVALLRGEDPESPDFDLKGENQRAIEGFVSEIKKGKITEMEGKV